MKGMARLMCGVVVLGLVVSITLAADPTSTPAGGRLERGQRGDMGPGGRGGYDLEAMEKVLKLTDEQKAKLKEKIEAAKTSMDDWRKTNVPKLEEARKALKAATEADDKAAMEKAKEQIKALEEDRAKLMAKNEREILSVLTPEQRLQWTEHQLLELAKREFRAVDLTEEQITKIKDLAKAPAKQIVELKDDVQKARMEIQRKFIKDIRENVLTAEQKAKLEKERPASRPGRGGDQPGGERRGGN